MSLLRHRPLAASATAAMLMLTLGAVGTAATADPGDRAERRLSEAKSGDTVQLVHVSAPSRKERNRLASLGLDLTEHGDSSGLSVVLHGPEDAAILREAGFRWRVVVPDLAAQARADARRDREYAASVARSPLPSGRTSYRDLADYNRELRALARHYPHLTRPITLPLRSVEGRRIHGIEITTHADRRGDGKPVMLMVGAHHAREWPSAEHTMEWAYDLLRHYRSAPRTRQIVRRVRTIVVPVVNVDGFVVSRQAQAGGDFGIFDYEMKRKNCSVSVFTPPEYAAGTCADNPAGRLRGTDLNRNYPGFWGGPGADPVWSSDTYRGDAPASEPEVRALRRLVSARQVVSLITNHTFSDLVLRPPSLFSTGYSPDEPAYDALGARMARHNGYVNQPSFQLYDTSGSLEDWSYWNTGGFGFTFEIGADEFHGPYQDAVVAEYLGLPPAAGAGKGGNREAYYELAEATMHRSLHSVITGRVRPGTTLRIRKFFTTQTAPVIGEDGQVGPPRAYEDFLTSTLRPTGRRFRWDVNPSTRPLVAGRWGREPLAPTQSGYDLVNPPGIPAEGDSETLAFTVAGLPEYDNFAAEVHVHWDDPSVDWDVYLYDAQGNYVGSAASTDDPEIARLIEPAAGQYTAVIENYAGGETSDYRAWVEFAPPPKKVVTGVKESWKLTCLNGRGRPTGRREVVVDRGQTVHLGWACRTRRH